MDKIIGLSKSMVLLSKVLKLTKAIISKGGILIENKICYGCMANIQDHKICPFCGYDNTNTKHNNLYIKPSTIINGYMFGRVLGHGGFGITYIAKNINNNQIVAIKEYFPQGQIARATNMTVSVYTGREENYSQGMIRFKYEAELLKKFDKFPGIVDAIDYFEANNTAYFVMEYVEGITLKEYVSQKGGLTTFDNVKAILMPIMDALEEMHRHGIIHRDISPDNIYITKNKRIKLLDFGAARYANNENNQSLSIIIKHGYAPKEQYYTKGNQGPWTDVYALAATAYYAITGETPQSSLERMQEDTLVYPSRIGADISLEEEKVLMVAMSIKEKDRYQNMRSFQKALKKASEYINNQEYEVKHSEVNHNKASHTDVKQEYETNIDYNDTQEEQTIEKKINYVSYDNISKEETNKKRRSLKKCVQWIVVVGIVLLAIIQIPRILHKSDDYRYEKNSNVSSNGEYDNEQNNEQNNQQDSQQNNNESQEQTTMDISEQFISHMNFIKELDYHINNNLSDEDLECLDYYDDEMYYVNDIMRLYKIVYKDRSVFIHVNNNDIVGYEIQVDYSNCDSNEVVKTLELEEKYNDGNIKIYDYIGLKYTYEFLEFDNILQDRILVYVQDDQPFFKYKYGENNRINIICEGAYHDVVIDLCKAYLAENSQIAFRVTDIYDDDSYKDILNSKGKQNDNGLEICLNFGGKYLNDENNNELICSLGSVPIYACSTGLVHKECEKLFNWINTKNGFKAIYQSMNKSKEFFDGYGSWYCPEIDYSLCFVENNTGLIYYDGLDGVCEKFIAKFNENGSVYIDTYGKDKDIEIFPQYKDNICIGLSVYDSLGNYLYSFKKSEEQFVGEIYKDAKSNTIYKFYNSEILINKSCAGYKITDEGLLEIQGVGTYNYFYYPAGRKGILLLPTDTDNIEKVLVNIKEE